MLAEEEEHLVVFFYEENIFARRLLKQLFLAQEKFNHINKGVTMRNILKILTNSPFDTLMKKCSA